MLDLDSNRWKELDHAYGVASDLPPLMRQLASGDSRVMDEIFGAVCHQGSIYDASYAIVPHLVAAAKAVSDLELRAEILILVGSVRASQDDRSKAPPADDIKQWYEAALPEALALALTTFQTPIDAPSSVYLLQAAAALKGYNVLGRILSGFVDEEFILTCPHCASDLYVWPESKGLLVSAEDPIASPKTKRTLVSRGPLEDSNSYSAYKWLMQIGACALNEIGDNLPFLFGSATCPACGRTFILIDELGK